MQRYEPKPWDIRRCDMVPADEGKYVLYCVAQAEIERLTVERDFFLSEVKLRNRIPSTNDTAADLLRRAEKAEAERDEAQAQVVAASLTPDDLIDLIGEFGREVYHLLDDCETSGPVGEEIHTITEDGLRKVSAILDHIEALPFEEPGIILGAGAMLQAAIMQTFAHPPQPSEAVVEAAQALGSMPEGYCFCSTDRIGDDSKAHEPECADLRAALAAMETSHDG